MAKAFVLPAHRHIELKAEGITYNNDRGLKDKPFANLKKLLKENQA